MGHRLRDLIRMIRASEAEAAAVCASIVFGICGLLIILAPGCGRSSPRVIDAASRLETAIPEAPLVDPGDARHFAIVLVEAVREGRQEDVTSLFDWEACASEVWRDIPAGVRYKKAFNNGARDAGIFHALIADVTHGGHFSFLHERISKGRTTVVMRMIPAEGGINYYEFFLKPLSEGKVVSDDMLDYAAGARVTESLRHVALQLSASMNRSVFDRVVGADAGLITHLKDWETVCQVTRTHQWEAALDAYNRLPPSLQTDRTCLLARYAAASALEKSEMVVQTIEAMRDNDPDNPNVELLSIEMYRLRKDLPRMDAAFARIDEEVGGDEYLEALRASSHFDSGDLEGALEIAQQLIHEGELDEQSLPATYLATIVAFNAAIAEKKFPVAAVHYRRLKQLSPELAEQVDRGDEWKMFRQDPSYSAPE